MISVIIVQYNRGDLTSSCIDSLVRSAPPGHEIIVVDNGSPDGSGETIRARYTSIRVLQQKENRGFGAANNAGARAAHGDLLFFLNNDTEVKSDPLAPLEAYMRDHPECGAAGVSLKNPDGSGQVSSGRWPTIVTEWLTKMERGRAGGGGVVEWLTGAALCVRKGIFDQVGGFDEGYFMYFEDVDLCRRIADTGRERHLIPSIEILHFGGGSQPESLRPAMQVVYRQSQVRYYERHGSPVQLRLLRLYLRVKSLWEVISGSEEDRESARGILRLLEENRNASCDGRS